jgi:hypothetical protein
MLMKGFVIDVLRLGWAVMLRCNKDGTCVPQCNRVPERHPLPHEHRSFPGVAGLGGLLARLQPYRQAIPGRARFELAVTALPFAILWLAMRHSLAVGYWLTLLLAVPAAGFLVRLFVIQHDCGHGSFFSRL